MCTLTIINFEQATDTKEGGERLRKRDPLGVRENREQHRIFLREGKYGVPCPK